jgi:hypothetical protein
MILADSPANVKTIVFSAGVDNNLDVHKKLAKAGFLCTAI